MKIFKKTFFVFLFILTFVLVKDKIYANSDKKIESEKSNKINETYFFSREVPNDVIVFAKKMFQKNFLKSDFKKNVDKVYLCRPFLLESSSVYTFLIRTDKEVLYSLMVFNNKNKNDTLTWQFNKGRTLNKIKEKITDGGIYKMNFKQENLDLPCKILFEKLDKMDDNFVDITKSIDVKYFKENFKTKDIDYQTPYPYEYELPMEPMEFQENLPWCSAYSGGIILSYELGEDIRAYDIMKWVFPSYSYSKLISTPLSDSKLISYANYKGSYPFYVDYALTRDEIMEEITSKRMIYAGCKNLNKKSFHAMVVYGYKKDVSYKVFNPWNEYYDVDMNSSNIETYNGINFYWIDSIKNWTW